MAPSSRSAFPSEQSARPGDDGPTRASAGAASAGPPNITLPRGGGAIRGIGETFTTNPVTGTASLSVPLPVSPGRSGFQPQLSLSYDSGTGNGPFGMGWSLNLPAITRRTDKGVPRYDDANESDEFMLAGAEVLVPGVEHERTADGVAYVVRRYRPRVEGLFARIERWTRVSDGETHWRSITRENVTTLYGKTAESQIADPRDATHVFSWLICQSYDTRGNAILYTYRPEDSARVFESPDPQLTWAHERNRQRLSAEDPDPRSANRYPWRIQYGNRTPNRDADWRPTNPTTLAPDDWMFEIVFDYGADHYSPLTEEDAPQVFVTAGAAAPAVSDWPARRDPFSTYRTGFEIRTYRLCRRVLMFHHFPAALGIPDCLVRSCSFDYDEQPVATTLRAITQSGYTRMPDDTQANRYLERSLPPLELGYSRAPGADALAALPIAEIDADSLEHLPAGVDGAGYQWVDLDGEGAAGILTEQAEGWFYKRNLSANNVSDTGRVVARFGPAELVLTKPNATVARGEAQFLDLAGDGHSDLVQLSGPVTGLYERDNDDWALFRPFRSWPNIDIADPNLRLVDLDGDGLTDILLAEDERLTWYRSLGEDGFAPAIQTRTADDEERGPRLVFADGTNTVYLADMSGDGLSDLVRIRNGEICYWPGLGHGRFGSRVAMDNAPWFDTAEMFDGRRIRLADIDGSGVADVLYLAADGVCLSFNQSGNRWSEIVTLRQFGAVDNLAVVQLLDLLGSGTICLVWSSPLPSESQPLRYLDLMNGTKPHLLVSVVNNLGAETRVDYAPSTRFYLDDRAAGRPWITRLAFPVQCVARVETVDWVSRNRFVTTYRYHHGYFDGDEREFRGFGRVDQFDTEAYGALLPGGAMPEASNLDPATHVPPVETRTWFHTGAALGQDRISRLYTAEYFADAAGRHEVLDDTILPAGLTDEEAREACRALKGQMLRQEIYGRDNSARAGVPYTVVEQNFSLRMLQARGDNRHAVVFSHPRETITYHYERNQDDPRVSHRLTLDVDLYGNTLKEANIAYGRPHSDLALAEDQARQTTSLITYIERRFTHPLDDFATHPDDYRAPLPAEERTYELTGLQPEHGAARFTFAEWIRDDFALPAATDEIAYEDVADPAIRQRRLIEQVRTLYRADDLDAELPLGSVAPLALPGETYHLAFTPGLLTQVYRNPLDRRPAPGDPPPVAFLPVPGDVLPVAANGESAARGGYVASETLRGQGVFPATAADPGWTRSDADGHWWRPSGVVFYSPGAGDPPTVELTHARQHFFLPHQFRDPFGAIQTVAYDADSLLTAATRDAAGNQVTAQNDYRTLLPATVTDANGNQSATSFDALGLVVGTAVMGKPPPAPATGDSLIGFQADLTPAEVDAVYNADDPREPARALLADATTRIIYDVDRFQRSRRDNPTRPETWLPVYAATVTRETHVSQTPAGAATKIQIGFSYGDGFGREIQQKLQAEPGPVVADGPRVEPRWRGSGWTIFNNKGNPVRQYEPFFSQLAKGHQFEFGIDAGVSPILFYDPVGRMVATLHPNHAWEKIRFDAWQQETWDVNDTVLLDPRTDPDLRHFVLDSAGQARLPEAEYLPTWHGLRTDPAHAAAAAARWPDPRTREAERDAATKTAAHAGTLTIVHIDPLGRTFLTLTDNGLGADQRYPTRVALDIEGNQREIRDAIVHGGDQRGRLIATFHYDMLGNRIHRASMEAGERWFLNDISGRTIRAWDSRGHLIRTEYDRLRRPLRTFVTGANAAAPTATHLVERQIYGEQHPQATARNLRGKLFLHLDQAGALTHLAYDDKGNLLATTRRIAREYKSTIDWRDVDDDIPAEPAASLDVAALTSAIAPLVTGETFSSTTAYDALNRPIQVVPPHSDQTGAKLNVIQPVYNETRLLERLDVWLDLPSLPTAPLDPASTAPSPAGIANIDYDAKGQRLRVDYQNGATTFYRYDAETFRLARLYTRRGAGFTDDCGGDPAPPFAAPDFPPPAVSCGVQNLHYTYDPSGNITRLRDDAQQTIYFRNRRVEPSADYTYDPLYRLIAATGREHLGQGGGAPIPHSYNDAPRAGLLHPGDGNAMGMYSEEYRYDAAGNFEQMIHRGAPGVAGWTRDYLYTEPSQLEAGKTSNRLTSTTVGSEPPETYGGPGGYDRHGNMLRMPQLAALEWDFADQLRMTQRQAVNGSDTEGLPRQGERTWYVYDASGQRVRKITETATGGVKDERLYLSGFEMYRRQGTNPLTRETLHVMDGTRRVALVETRIQGADGSPPELIRFQFGNHLGSACLELTADARILSYEEYSPYGSTTYQAVRSQTESAKRYRFTGMERDEESGLSQHGARYYAPWLGRWVSCDPAGLVDGHNLYRYARGNPTGLTDRSGRQSDDPTKPPELPGVGITLGGGKVKIGPLTPPPNATACDELNPLCKGITITIDPKGKIQPAPPPDAGGDEKDESGSGLGPFSGIKTYSPAPNTGVVWRKTNPFVDPNPLLFGFSPKNPNASFSPGEHALGEHLPGGSQYVSGSHRPGGATNIEGDPFAIDPKKTGGTRMIDTPEIAADLDQKAQQGRFHPERVDKWKETQRTTEGVRTKPGEGLKGEVLFEGHVPPSAIETPAIRALKGAGRALFWVGIALTVWDLGNAIIESIELGSIKPLAKEVVRQTGAWGGAIGGAKAGAVIGSFFGPVGTVVGGIVGGLIGGAVGYIAGSWLADLF